MWIKLARRFVYSADYLTSSQKFFGSEYVICPAMAHTNWKKKLERMKKKTEKNEKNRTSERANR